MNDRKYQYLSKRIQTWMKKLTEQQSNIDRQSNGGIDESPTCVRAKSYLFELIAH